MARRTAEQLAQTRQNLIDAAKQVFAEKGYTNTQIADITQQAGTGMSAFYGQFENKEALFLMIVHEMFDELHAGVVEIRRGMNLNSPLDMLILTQQIYQLVFETLYKHAQITLSVFRSGVAATPEIERLYWQICDAVADALSQDMQRGEAVGLLNIESRRDMADAMFGMVQQLAHRMVLDGSPTPAQASRVCTQYTIGALLMHMPKSALQHILPALAALPTDLTHTPSPATSTPSEVSL
ncbi:MAG: TetR/AcrR family transcriptional regulator [Pseudomonadota bacterium]|nr:TetR/AcrR family transcriptional regulator [Pseudomonadota bacterium]